MINLSNSLMLNPGALLTLAFKKMMLYDNSRKMGDPVSPAQALCTMAKKVKTLHKGLFSQFNFVFLGASAPALPSCARPWSQTKNV